jgi:hypothetical protein
MLPTLLSAQNFFRVSADFSIKETYGDSLSRLTMGRVFFDQNERKIVYRISFPETQTMVMSDTMVQTTQGDSVVTAKSVPRLIDFSLFNLILKDELNNFGMQDSFFRKASVAREGDLIVTTWTPSERLQGLTGQVQIARQGKLIYGLVLYDRDDQVVARRFFRDYDLQTGLPFPKEMIQILEGETKSYTVTTFSNVRFNEPDSTGSYTLTLPE